MQRLGTSIFVLLVVGALAAAPAFADKPEWAGGGNKGDNYERGDQQRGDQDRHGRGEQERERREQREQFSERNREYVHNYYARQLRAGRCPPGLAKKQNGCMPPGQARKWQVGKPLPRDVVFYNLPRRLSTEIGPPPSGHRYVRVANDILLITIGTGMVVDAIEDLGRQ